MTSSVPITAGRPLPMTPWRRVALVIGTPLALLAIGYTALTAVAWAGLGSYRVNLAVPVHGRITAIGVDSGDVRISPGPGHLIRVRGTVRYSIVRPHLNWQRSRSGIAFRSTCELPTGECSFNYAITVPPSNRSEITDGSGDVTATGLAGTTVLTDASGNITATRLSGSTTISDNSGDIVVTSPAGGRVLIMNDSGDITGTGVSSQVLTAQDQSGDISVVFTKIPQRVQVSDSSGDITLVLPPGPTTYLVTASTSSGSTSINVPRSPTSPHVISATDQSGNITIVG